MASTFLVIATERLLLLVLSMLVTEHATSMGDNSLGLGSDVCSRSPGPGP